MKVVFLDFDGVLNSTDFMVANQEKRQNGSFLNRDEDEIDPAAVARLNRILEATGAVVCISSTWRILHKIGELNGFLKRRGFTGKLVGMTPRLHGQARRGHEIQEWIDWQGQGYARDPVESFVILDDDSDMEHLVDRLVQTDGSEGLQDRHVDRAIAMFMGAP